MVHKKQSLQHLPKMRIGEYPELGILPDKLKNKERFLRTLFLCCINKTEAIFVLIDCCKHRLWREFVIAGGKRLCFLIGFHGIFHAL